MRALLPLLVLLSVGFVVLTIWLATRRGGSQAELQRQNERLALENEAHREFLDSLHELLIEHQELDPALSTIALDELRQHRRRMRGDANKRKDLP